MKTEARFSLRDKRLFEIGEVEITRVDLPTWIVKVPNIRGPLFFFFFFFFVVVFCLFVKTKDGLCDCEFGALSISC